MSAVTSLKVWTKYKHELDLSLETEDIVWVLKTSHGGCVSFKYFVKGDSVNWKRMLQTGSAVATYVALMGAYLAGYSPLQFALYSAVLLSLWLSLYAIPAAATTTSALKTSDDAVIPSLSASMAELHSLQREINSLQSEFVAQTNSHQNASDNSAQ